MFIWIAFTLVVGLSVIQCIFKRFDGWMALDHVVRDAVDGNHPRRDGIAGVDQLFQSVQLCSISPKSNRSKLDDMAERRRQARCLQIEGHEFDVVCECHGVGSKAMNIESIPTQVITVK